MPLATEGEIQAHYAGQAAAEHYVRNRFTSEVQRLLHDRQVATVQSLIDRHRPEKVLEIAPGPGRVTRDLRAGGRLTCLEFNDGMIEQGRAVSEPGTTWVQGNAFELPFGEEFDLVYTFRFIRHFHRGDRNRLYAQVRRVLRPGGLFVMDAVNERVSRPLREAHPEEYPVYDKLYRPDDLRTELEEAGFEIASLAPVQKMVGLQCRSQNLIGPRVNALNRLIIRLLERLPRRDGLEWIVTCRRA
jgi:ubiquinone/menaquinone biosynthesis C-methylase UbiE